MSPRYCLRLSNDLPTATRRHRICVVGWPSPRPGNSRFRRTHYSERTEVGRAGGSITAIMVATGLLLALTPSALHGQGQALDYYPTHIGYQRHYILYVPSGYAPGTSTPLVVALHGSGQTGNLIMTISRMNEVAEQEGFLVAYPDAYDGNWMGSDSTDRYDDFCFMDALIAQVSSSYSADASRVYVTGLSNGAGMSYMLIIKRPYTFAAVAAVAMSRPCSDQGCTGYLPPWIPATPSRPFPLLHIHGTADPVVPYNGGRSHGYYWPPVEQYVGGFAANNGCDTVAGVTDLPDIDLADGCAWKPPEPPCTLSSHVQVLTYGNCDSYLDAAGNLRPAEVVFYKVVDGRHSWPGGDYSAYTSNSWNFPVNNDINASQEIWNFFKRHRLAVAWADLDSDLDVDAADVEIFEACATGPGIPYDPDAPPDGCTAAQVVRADADQDGDVDQADFGSFQRCLSGEGQRPGMNCAN